MNKIKKSLFFVCNFNFSGSCFAAKKELRCRTNRASGSASCGKTAFTLAETLIALVILGIIAAVTIPTLIRNHVDNANRAKVKKAMTMYEKAFNNMIIENDLRSTDAIRTFGTTDAQGNASANCPQTNPYFKTVEGANCRFKTADGVWWDISDITNPIIILDSNLKDETTANLRDIADNDVATNKTVFAMIGRYEEDKGILRINDKAYEDGQDDNATNIAYMKKLWEFVNNQTSGGNAGGGEGGGGDEPVGSIYAQACAAVANGGTCEVNGLTYTKVVVDEDYSFDCDSEGSEADECNYIKANSTAAAGTYYVTDLGPASNIASVDVDVCKNIDSNLRLANAAELQQLHNSNIISGDCYWAYEEFTQNSFHVDVCPGGTTYFGGVVYPDDGRIACVSD